MEDNIYMSKGVLAKSNVEFVEKAKTVCKEYGREIATPAEARQILGLPAK
jgi:3-keto-5-aminohexanoate cleavage enzyme